MIPRSRQRDVHQAPFLIDLGLSFHGTRRWKPAVHRPDDEDGVPFLSLRTVRGAEHQRRFIVVGGSASEILRTLRRLECERGQERIAVRISRGDVAQLIEIGKTRIGAVVAFLEDAVVQPPNVGDLAGDIVILSASLQIPQQIGKRLVRVACPGWRHEVGEGVGIPGAVRHRLQNCTGGDVADSRHEHQDPVPAHLVPWIVDDTQKGEDVFHMRRLEEFESTPLLERDVTVHELDLEIGRHITGAEDHRDVIQCKAVFAELENSIDDEARLLFFIAGRHQPWANAAGPFRPEILGEPFRSARDDGVRHVENRLRRPVVLLERHDASPDEVFREIEDVPEVRAAERVDALRVVADDGDVAMTRRHPLEDARLKEVGVLILVDENVLIEIGELPPEGGQFDHERPVEEEVVVVEQVALLLSSGVFREGPEYPWNVVRELWHPGFDDMVDGELAIHMARIDVVERFFFREPFFPRAEAERITGELHEIFRVALIHDRKVGRQAGRLSEAAKQLVTRRVKRAAVHPA